MRPTTAVVLGAVLALTSAAAAEEKPRVQKGEVIVIEELMQPAVPPKPRHWQQTVKAPPYSDRAILEDAWTRAWLLLDVDQRGTVVRLKMLRPPGYDLEDIAIREAFKLSFEPARNDRGEAVRTLVVWPIEWVAQSWYRTRNLLPTRMPETVGFGNDLRSAAALTPCKGSGPWRMTSVYKGYRDCSRPDLTKANAVPWIVRPAKN
jgi:hypothetical protein